MPNDFYAGESGGVIAAGRYHFPANARIAIWGQSNALGRALRSDISAAPLSSDSGLAAYDAGTFSRVYIFDGTSAYQQLQPSVYNYCDAGQFGPEFGLAVRWMRETTSGNLYIEKEAGSGISITQFNPADAQFPQMVNRRAAANSWLSSHGVTVVDSGFLWVQGESDAAQTQGWYQPQLEAILTARDTALQTTATKRMLAQMAVGTGGYGAGVASAKSAIASNSQSNTFELSMNYYSGDNMHINARGQLQLGYDAFEKSFGVSHRSA